MGQEAMGNEEASLNDDDYYDYQYDTSETMEKKKLPPPIWFVVIVFCYILFEYPKKRYY